ncbi:Alpha/Beta hydrolase protein, partial [Pyronema omphalodes]
MAPRNSSQYSLCPSTAKISAKLLLSFLVLSPLALVAADRIRVGNNNVPGNVLSPGPVIIGGGSSGGDNEHDFSLRHIMIHGTHEFPELLRRKDIHPNSLVATEEDPTPRARPIYGLRSQVKPIKRMLDRTRATVEGFLLDHRRGFSTSATADAWGVDQVVQPDITDKETVLSLARISADAYTEIEHTGDWLEVGTPYNLTNDFGWQADGLRGHIFSNQDNTTVIIGLKGTSAAVFDGADTTTNDKINDNLLFSCCCARVSYFWSTVCDCFSGTAYTCNNVCLKKELTSENRYYRASLQLYYNVTQLYPGAQVWVVGHSLGGAVSSLIGQTYGLPVVAFEAPGEALAAGRLGLPLPPGMARQNDASGIYHFGHTADPIYMGACNGPTSICALGGYAMESRCHSGQECTYDVVGDKGWRMGLGYHRIQGVIRDVIEAYDTVPKCTYDPGCTDCFNWKFTEGNDTSTTTTGAPVSPTATGTLTATTTCATPGWWGCRDGSTTTDISSTGSVTSTSKLHPTGSASPTSSGNATTTCTHVGWFGNCLDPSPYPTTTKTKHHTSITITDTRVSGTDTVAPTETESCRHYGWFGGCLDPEWPPATVSPSASASGSAVPGSSSTAVAKPTQKVLEDDVDWVEL